MRNGYTKGLVSYGGNRTKIMKETYWVAIVAMLMGAALIAAAAGLASPTGIKNVVLAG